jgi:hypothetical protein
VSSPEQPQWLTAEQAQQMVADALAQAQEQHAASSNSAGSITVEQAQAMIDQALARQAEAHNDAIKALGASMRGSVVTFVAHNAGGPGTEIADTWSAWDQAQAHAADEAARKEAAA